ncbi:gamma-glutamylcyclotransferase [Photobacterium profundum]|uniref:Gamma-glutamylcyclotransferase family protein n=1 Tax=Photobacterium profundum 3TCK TaxID=314280 RepID=Q1Z4M5_9GAMM|nr:gamma-glutamylcyclotransferase family protein [Photobacterium profundum]EAS43596.1 hypothetical protein P3TCK_02029 [Photobacterium profundum 3TCK]PSV60162.1 gamma-glutamylcyclotransferase [Photobacterium profundum]
MSCKVLVYGTLRAGQSNHHWLKTADFLGACKLDSGYALYDLGLYPALLENHDCTLPLYGEVYKVDNLTLQALDRLEGYPTLYERHLVSTVWGEAWVYTYQLSIQGRPQIMTGDWNVYVKHRQ